MSEGEPTEGADAAFIAWLLSPAGGYTIAIPIGDGRWVGIQPLMFHWTMHIGRMGDRCGYDDRYCYQTMEIAINALVEWSIRGFKGEPEKWHRHPKTTRRRPDGDASKEYKAS